MFILVYTMLIKVFARERFARVVVGCVCEKMQILGEVQKGPLARLAGILIKYKPEKIQWEWSR